MAEGYSLDAQEHHLRSLCDSLGWPVGDVYMEEGASGSSLDRPQIQALLRDIRSRRYPDPCIVVWRLDRLTRSVADLYTLLTEFEALGAMFRSATEPYDTTSAIGRLFVTLVAALAQWERENILERSALGQIHQVTQTQDWYGGSAPYGYKLLKDSLEIDPSHARVVSRIFADFMAGSTINAIAQSLNAEGVVSPKGTRWYRNTVRYILRNGVYAGLRTWRKRTKTKTSSRPTARSEWVVATGEHPAIVPRELWEQVMVVLDSNVQVQGKRGWGKHPLTGLLRCGSCGRRMTGRELPKHDKVYRYYVCPNHQQERTCDMLSVRADRLEQFVLDLIHHRFSEDALLRGATANSSEEPSAVTDLRLRVESARQRTKRWQDAYEVGAIDASELATRLRTLRAEERDALDALRQMSRASSHVETLSAAESWDSMASGERRAFMHELIEEVTVYRDQTVDIAWR